MMKRQPCLRFAIFFGTLCGPLLAGALPPDQLRNYRFVPRYSTLDVSGGFAGFDLELPIHGTFSFVTGYHSLSDNDHVIPALRKFARFTEVDAQGINPADFGPYSFDLDDSLNLSGLRGTPGPLLLPLENWQFHGEDGQGAPMQMLAVELGRWLVMLGSNDAPCCDFFDYEIQAVARQVPFADFDDDGDSDQDDMRRILSNLGVAGHAQFEQGDTDADGDIDGYDFLSAQRDYGDSADKAVALAASALAPTTRAVPEPSCGFIGLLAAACLLHRFRI